MVEEGRPLVADRCTLALRILRLGTAYIASGSSGDLEHVLGSVMAEAAQGGRMAADRAELASAAASCNRQMAGKSSVSLSATCAEVGRCRCRRNLRWHPHQSVAERLYQKVETHAAKASSRTLSDMSVLALHTYLAGLVGGKTTVVGAEYTRAVVGGSSWSQDHRRSWTADDYDDGERNVHSGGSEVESESRRSIVGVEDESGGGRIRSGEASWAQKATLENRGVSATFGGCRLGFMRKRYRYASGPLHVTLAFTSGSVVKVVARGIGGK